MSTPSATFQKPLLGEVRPTIDGKNRVTIPADWREIIGGNEIYVMVSLDKKCLKMLPPAEMDRLITFVNTLSGEDRTETLTKIGSASRCVRWDSQGRCVLPDDLCKQLGLTGEVVMRAALQILEIWPDKNLKAGKAKTDAIAEPNLRKFGGL